jgi:hypothetical protein
MKIAIPSKYQNFKYILVSSFLTSIITIVLLEFFRIFSPLALIENDIIKNILTLLIYIITPFILCYRILYKGTLLEELFQGIIFAVITWLLWAVMICVYLTIKSIVISQDTLSFSLDFILPLIGLFFIYFIIGGVLGSIIHYTKNETTILY